MKTILIILLALGLTSCLATQAAQEDLARATATLNERAADAATTDSQLAEAVEQVQAALKAIPEAAKSDAINLGGAFSTQGVGTTLAGLIGLWVARNSTRKKDIAVVTETTKPTT